MAKAAVKTVSIEALALDAANARKHTDRNAQAVAASLRRFGPGRSIVLDKNDVVRAGNQTLQSARDAGMTEVLIIEPGPHQLVAVKRSDWSETEATGYAIADNRAAEHAEWNDEILAEQLASLEIDGLELGDVGFTSDELDALIEKNGLEPINDGGERLDGETDSDVATAYLKWGSEQVPMTEGELNALQAKLEAHVAERGTKYGFVAGLLRAPASD